MPLVSALSVNAAQDEGESHFKMEHALLPLFCTQLDKCKVIPCENRLIAGWLVGWLAGRFI